MLHPIETAALVERSGYPDHVSAAAVLHEILEDTDAALWELEERFGVEVANLVATMTKDPRVGTEQEQRRQLRARIGDESGNAAAVFAADKIRRCGK